MCYMSGWIHSWFSAELVHLCFLKCLESIWAEIIICVIHLITLLCVPKVTWHQLSHIGSKIVFLICHHFPTLCFHLFRISTLNVCMIRGQRASIILSHFFNIAFLVWVGWLSKINGCLLWEPQAPAVINPLCQIGRTTDLKYFQVFNTDTDQASCSTQLFADKCGMTLAAAGCWTKFQTIPVFWPINQLQEQANVSKLS